MAIETTVMWTVSVGMGVVVVIVVVILLHLLLQSVRALDKRVDHVLAAAVGIIENTSAAVPQLQATLRNVTTLQNALEAKAQQTKPVSAPARSWRSQ